MFVAAPQECNGVLDVRSSPFGRPKPSVSCEVMRWPRNSEDRGAWSAVGVAIFAVAVGAAVAFWVPAARARTPLPWEVYVSGAVAIGGLYLAVAPLLHLAPWRDRRRGIGSIHIPTGEVPLHTASPPLPSEEELARIAASRDPRFSRYGMVKQAHHETVRLVPPNGRTPQGRLEAHAERGKALMAQIGETLAKYTASPMAALAAGVSAEIEVTALVMDVNGWIKTAGALVERLAPSLLDEYRTDYGSGASSVLGLGAEFYRLRERLRQRVDGLERTIDAMDAP